MARGFVQILAKIINIADGIKFQDAESVYYEEDYSVYIEMMLDINAPVNFLFPSNDNRAPFSLK